MNKTFYFVMVAMALLFVCGCDKGMQINAPAVSDHLGEPVRNCEVERGDPSELIEPMETDNPNDFIGIVIIYELTEAGEIVRPLPNVIFTIVSGPRRGESVVTNQHGHYLFPDIERDALHMRAVKPCFESKEVIVSRTQPTTLPDGSAFNGHRRNNPGDILLGHEWPQLVRKTLE